MKLQHFLSGLVITLLVLFPRASGSLPGDAQRELYQKILENYPQELEQARKSGEPLFELGVLNQGASAYQYFGQFERAIALYEQALAIARQVEDSDLQGSILWSLAIAHSKLGDAYGINFLESQLAEEQQPKFRLAILKYLSTAYSQSQDLERSLVLREDYVRLVRQIGTKMEEVSALNDLGLGYFALRQYDRAIAVHEEALALVKGVENATLHGGILVHLGISYSYADREDKALAQFEALLELGRETGNVYQQEQALNAISEYYTIQEDYERAIAIQNDRLELAKTQKHFTDEAFALQDLSRIYYWSGELKQAIAIQQKSLDLIDRGFKQQQAEIPAAAEVLEYSSSIAQALGYEKLGFLWLQANDLANARSSFRNALEGLEQQRQQIIINPNFVNMSKDQLSVFAYDQATDVYRLLQQIAVRENKPLQGLELSEAGRARALVDLLVSKLSTNPTAIAKTPPPTIEQIRHIAKTENSTLVTYTVQYEYGRFYQYGPGQWLKGEPPEKIATELYIWVIQPNGKITFRSVPLNFVLDDLVRGARNSIILQGQGRLRRRRSTGEPLKELHGYLIEPITDLLPSDPQARVTFIPQDSLLLVPFPALQDANGTYLVEQHTLMTSPSIQVLDLTRKNRLRNQQQRRKDTQALVVGNPTMPEIRLEGGDASVQLDPLPGAEQEAETIATLLQTEALIGDAATKPATIARMESAPIIHFATHGLLDDRGGFLSSLALAPTSDDSGFLTAKEIAGLSLTTELAVLSACDTGRGTINGDGVVGLSRAFVSAGAEGVLVSLWAIPDRPTVVLMEEFYQQLQQGKDKASALRSAMAIAKQQFPEPHNWAAFTFIGVSE